MDLEPHEPAQPDVRAQRVRTIIIVLMAVFIAAPFLVYFIAGSHVAPTQ